jgi:hypothetical protein
MPRGPLVTRPRSIVDSRAVDDAIADLTLTASPRLLGLANQFREPSLRFNLAAQGVPISESAKYGHADEASNLIQPFRNAVRQHLGQELLPSGPRLFG